MADFVSGSGRYKTDICGMAYSGDVPACASEKRDVWIAGDCAGSRLLGMLRMQNAKRRKVSGHVSGWRLRKEAEAPRVFAVLWIASARYLKTEQQQRVLLSKFSAGSTVDHESSETPSRCHRHRAEAAPKQRAGECVGMQR